MCPCPSYDSILVSCADGRLLTIVVPSDLLLSDKDGWAGELELADVHQVHTGPILQVQALPGEGAAVSIDPSGVILAWSLISCQCIASLRMFSGLPTVDEAATAIAALGCGRLIAAGSRSGGVAIFDMSTISNRKCVFWSRLDMTPVVAIAAHPSLPVVCVAFQSNCVVFLSITPAATCIIGRSFTDTPIDALHWFDSGTPGHVLLLLHDSSLLRMACPPHDTPHSIHCTASLETFAPIRLPLSDIISGLSGHVSVLTCRLVVSEHYDSRMLILSQMQRRRRRCRRRLYLHCAVYVDKTSGGAVPALALTRSV